MEAAGLEILRMILRHHPADLAGRNLSGSVLVQLGRMTGTALASFAEAPFRSGRFLAAAERAS